MKNILVTLIYFTILLSNPFVMLAQNKIYRNTDIELLILDKARYENEFRPFMETLTQTSLLEMLFAMEQSLKDSKAVSDTIEIDNTPFTFNELYDTEVVEGLTNLQRQIFFELIDSCRQNNKSALNEDELWAFSEKMLIYNAGAFFTSYFYRDFATYSPPFEMAGLFYPIWEETTSFSNRIEMVNPYAPFLEDPEGNNKLYYFILFPEMVEILRYNLASKREVLNKIPILTKDLLFLDYVFRKAIEGELLLIFKETP